MSREKRLEALELRHRSLDEQIMAAQRRPYADIDLTDLKRQKLRLKEEIMELSANDQ